MNKFLGLLLISSISFGSLFGVNIYTGSTTAAVTLAGGILKTKQLQPIEKKYKRSQCPVCKGKGWYVSGDEITKVPCGYCEPETEAIQQPRTIIHRR